MMTAVEAAEFLIELANKTENSSITSLQLNKLLYYAQGCNIQRSGKPLFQDLVVVWKHGPVIDEVYHKYKWCGNRPIPTERAAGKSAEFSRDAKELLIDVFREYGNYAPEDLIDMTHANGTPWYDSRQVGSHVISIDQLREYFSRMENYLPQYETSNKLPVVTSLPADLYDPEDDAVWG